MSAVWHFSLSADRPLLYTRRHLEPTSKVRAAYRKLAEAKDAEATSAKAEELRRKEEKRLRAVAKREEDARVKEQNRKFLESLS